MMASILNLEPWALREAEPAGHAAQGPTEPLPATADYEIVLGRAQIASWLFVGVIAVVVCSSLAYLAGEAIAAKTTYRVRTVESAPIPAAAPSLKPVQLPQATIVVPPKKDRASIVKTVHRPEPPLFAEPAIGKVYLQVGAVEQGMAMILVEGLRSHGFNSFVAPGPSDRIYRVLIGPLPDPDAFRQAMIAVTALDLANFARKYEK